MNILILGSGGREHAFALKLSQSNKINQLFVAPGNAGTSAIARNVALNISDFEAIKTFAIQEKVDFCCIDPFNQMTNDYKGYGGRTDKYLETFLAD